MGIGAVVLWGAMSLDRLPLAGFVARSCWLWVRKHRALGRSPDIFSSVGVVEAEGQISSKTLR